MVMLGVLVALATASVYMPKIIEWYFEPPSNIGISCAPAITWAFQKFQVAQWVSVGIGAVAGFFVGLRLSRKKTPASVEIKS